MTALLVFALFLLPVLSVVQIVDLRVNYMESPLGLTAIPRFSWVLFDSSYTRGLSQRAYNITVWDSNNMVVWYSGLVVSNRTSLIRYQGKDLQSSSKYTWSVSIVDNKGSGQSSAFASFVTGLLLPSDWTGTWITGNQYNQIRKEFVLPYVPNSAFVHVSGIGYFTLHCNGRKVGDHHLDVGWSDYARRAYYVTFDLLPYLNGAGQKNALAITLGNGWFSCSGNQPGCINSPPQFILQLNAKRDTQSTSVVSDSSWRAFTGPITYDSLYNGETYDATLETPGWTLPNYPDSNWVPVSAAKFTPPKLSPQVFEPIRTISRFVPHSISEPVDGTYVVDFGQNTAGKVHLRIRNCPKGTKVQIRHAELLTHPPYGPVDGSIYVGNLRSARATDVYICKADPSGIEDYEPTFTQHGFRFAEVTGLPEQLLESDIYALEMHTDVEEVGEVSTNQDLLNKIQHAVVWGQKSNLMSVPTDCDQRDERRGWMGDAALSVEEAVLNFRMGAFYTHWLDMIRDDQNSDGSVPDFVPSLGDTGDGAPNWETAYPTIIWTLYRYYGDTDLVLDHWPAIQRYISFFDGRYNQTGLKNFFTGYGDWVPPPPQPMANGHLVGAFSYLHDLILYAELADGVGQSGIAANVRLRLTSLLNEFNTAFYNPSKFVYGSGLQTEMAMALWLHAVPQNDIPQVVDYLVKDITQTHTVHPTTGILGWRYLLEVLTEYQVSDVGVLLNLQTTYPSFGYMIQGVGNYEPATTVWELWNSDSEGPGMNSRNHIMFGSNGIWLYKTILGIVPSPADASAGLKTGFDRFQVGPDFKIVNNVGTTTASGRVSTPHGIVQVRWHVEFPKDLTCVSNPENSDAMFSCPNGKISSFDYAYYGTPKGDCTKGWTQGDCNSAVAKAKVEAACVGKTSCSFPVGNDFFGGDPCINVVKNFAGKVACSSPTNLSPMYRLNVIVPIGSSARVLIPIVSSLSQTLQNLKIFEGSQLIWSAQKYVPGANGIIGASVNTASNGVLVDVSSGSYMFTGQSS